MRKPARTVYHHDTGFDDFDRARFLLPPPLISSFHQTRSGLRMIDQSGHSSVLTTKTQECTVSLEDTYALVLFPEGAADLEIHVQGKRLSGRGDGLSAFVAAPHAALRFVAPPSDIRIVHLFFPTEALSDAVGDADSAPSDRTGFVALDPSHAALTSSFCGYAAEGVLAIPLLLETYAVMLARLLHGDVLCRSPTPSGGIAATDLNRIRDYVEAHIGESVDLTELGALAGMPAPQFVRAFRRTTGLAPHAWLARQRIRRAERLWAHARDTDVAEVARSVGFASPHLFRVAFKRVTGMTFEQWRRQPSL